MPILSVKYSSPFSVQLFCSKSRALGISPILLVAPNTSNKRIEKISRMADNLIYAVSILGITGNKLTRKDELKSYLKRLRSQNSDQKSCIVSIQYCTQKIFLIPTNLPQKLTPGRCRRAESESEVQNHEILHPDLENKENHKKKCKLVSPSLAI